MFSRHLTNSHRNLSQTLDYYKSLHLLRDTRLRLLELLRDLTPDFLLRFHPIRARHECALRVAVISTLVTDPAISSDTISQNLLLFQTAHADEDTMTISARSNSVHKRSATLLGSPCQRRAHYFHDNFRASFRVASDIRVAETGIDGIDDDEGGLCDSTGGNGADREELEELADKVAALIRILLVFVPVAGSCGVLRRSRLHKKREEQA